MGPTPMRVVLPEGNEQCSGKSALKPQPAHILAVGSHQSLFTVVIFSFKESCCAPQAEHTSLSRALLILLTHPSSLEWDPPKFWETR